LIDARNQADQMIYQVEKMMKDAGDKLSESDKAPVQSAIVHVREVMRRDDVQTLRRAVEELQQSANAMAQHIQGRQSAGATAGRDGAGHDGQGRDDVIDAEFEVKK
jgi:molecular chaperone DnaK